MPPPAPRRFAQIIRIKPTHLSEYIRIHNPIPLAIATQISNSNISDYSIFFDSHSNILFATFKYSGADFEADMDAMRNDPETRKWWAVTDAMQESFNQGSTGSEDTKATNVIYLLFPPDYPQLFSSMERALIYSHYYICKKPNMSKKHNAKALFDNVKEIVKGAHGAGEEARGKFNGFIDHALHDERAEVEDRAVAAKGREQLSRAEKVLEAGNEHGEAHAHKSGAGSHFH